MKRDDWSGDCHRISDGRTLDWRSRRVRERQVWKEVGFWRVNMGGGLGGGVKPRMDGINGIGSLVLRGKHQTFNI